jgi:hypothetical protein
MNSKRARDVPRIGEYCDPAPAALGTLFVNVATTSDPIAKLRVTGKELPPSLRASVLSLGDAAVPPLLAIVEDNELSMEDAPGDGWPPIHAVALLVELKAEAAIAPMLRILSESDFDTIIHNRAAVDLPKLGSAVLEPAMAALEATRDPDFFESLCFVLAKLDVHDERIFEAICDLFEEDPLMGAMCFADYGDARALPMIEAAIEEFVPDWNSPLGARDLVDFIDAYETLGGPLPIELAEHVENVRAEWKRRWDARSSGAGEAGSKKIGRNEPCPCASGKKYKKCCLGKALPA